LNFHTSLGILLVCFAVSREALFTLLYGASLRGGDVYVSHCVCWTRCYAEHRVFCMYGSAGTLTIHYYHHVRYAIPQHSSMVPDNDSNNSLE
jgi:hypothetical protein